MGEIAEAHERVDDRKQAAVEGAGEIYGDGRLSSDDVDALVIASGLDLDRAEVEEFASKAAAVFTIAIAQSGPQRVTEAVASIYLEALTAGILLEKARHE